MKKLILTATALLCSLISANAVYRDGISNGHDFVDLGLTSGTKWAAENIGAANPQNYGNYYCWGETATQSNYGWDTYKHCNGSATSLTKYCTSSSYGTVDNKTKLDSIDDAAAVNWKAKWKMPTMAQREELITECYWVWTSSYNGTGVAGYIVYKAKSESDKDKCITATMTPSSNYSLSDAHIFLPAGGYITYGSYDNRGSYGYYWTSEIMSTGISYLGQYLSILGSSRSASSDRRIMGMPVRAVRAGTFAYTVTAKASNEAMGSVSGSGTFDSGEIAVLKAKAGSGFKFLKWNDGVTDASRQVTVSQDTTLTAIFAYEDYSDGEENGQKYVDLGLTSQTRWATMNIGANSSQEHGEYYAWGETTPQSSATYSWATYKYANGSNTSLTKYCYTTAYGTKDGKRTLDAEDDAAAVNWGGSWTMPTKAQMTELKSQCYWVYTTNYQSTGVGGYIVYKAKAASDKGKKGTDAGSYTKADAHIFLPEAGYKYNGKNQENIGYGYYWTSDLYDSYPSSAFSLRFYRTAMLDTYGDSRCQGSTIRSTFVPDYTMTATANNDEYGTVSGSGTYKAMTTVSLSATPNEGYKLAKWSDGVIAPSRKIVLSKDSALTAIFEAGAYSITLSANNDEYGTVTGGGDFGFNKTATITATPNYGYRFVKWSDGATAASRDITVTQDSALTAEFTTIVYTITATANNTEYGTVTGGGEYNYKTTATLAATANYGYKLVKWSDGATDATREITVTQDSTITAEFEAIVYTISASTNDEEFGSVAGGGEYAYNTTATLTATPAERCKFVEWSDGVTAASRDIAVTQDSALTAKFVAEESSDGDESGHDYVDLGLTSGTKWATTNVGATNAEEYGEYYAWGETTPQAGNEYNWSSYKYANGAETKLKKYCNDKDYGYGGYTDELTVLETEDDAAAANWGGKWAMPTDEQEAELKNECYWVWTEDYNHSGVAGFVVYKAKDDADKGKYKSSYTPAATYKLTDTHIFLPAAGCIADGKVYFTGANGMYASSSLNTDHPNFTWFMFFNSADVYSSYNYRTYGRTVRAVIPSSAPTGMKNAKADSKAEVKKIMRDGAVYIIKGDEVYGVNGNRVK